MESGVRTVLLMSRPLNRAFLWGGCCEFSTVKWVQRPVIGRVTQSEFYLYENVLGSKHGGTTESIENSEMALVEYDGKG